MELIEIRCPFKYRSKYDQKTYPCNRLIVKIYPGSSGEGFCTSCKKNFEFEVNEQSFTKTSVKVQQQN